MDDRYAVRVSVLSQAGHCAAGHAPGDEWLVRRHTPAGMCVFAYSALDTEIRTLMFGGRHPWAVDPDVCVACCSDPANPVVFELRRVPLNEAG